MEVGGGLEEDGGLGEGLKGRWGPGDLDERVM